MFNKYEIPLRSDVQLKHLTLQNKTAPKFFFKNFKFIYRQETILCALKRGCEQR